MRINGARIVLAFVLCSFRGAPAIDAAQSPEQVQPAGEGRVAVTITTLEGTVHIPAVQVELRVPNGALVIARSLTDGAGQVAFPDVPPGQYVVTATHSGFVARDSAAFMVRAGVTTQVLLDVRLTFVPPDVQVEGEALSPTDSVQPVSTSDMMSGSILESSPLEGDDFQSLLPLLPGVVRDADGRLHIKGGQPTQGALQISSASLIDPSSGDFDVDLPGRSVESVEVLANPFAAEYGRFTTSVTQIRTRRGTNEWDVSPGSLTPRFRKFFAGIRAFEPRFSIRGPVKKDRIFLAQDVQFRYVASPVKSLPGEPETNVTSFDSFTRLDTVLSSRHTVGGGLILFPRELRNVTMNTFRPKEVTPDLNQSGWAGGAVDRFAIWPDLILETTVSLRQFEIDVNTTNQVPMVYAPETQSGGYFNDQTRDVVSVQWVEALSLVRNWRHGEHVFKFGTDLQRSHYGGSSISRPVEIRRLDGTLAECTDFGRSRSRRSTAPSSRYSHRIGGG